MALKTKEIMITAEGRDRGKLFVITEMPAMKASKWGDRLLLAMGRSGVDIGTALNAGGGIIGFAIMGIGALSTMAWPDAEALIDEAMACIQIRPNPENINIVRPLVTSGNGDDIEELATIYQLRMEVITLHTGFTLADARSALSGMQASAGQSTSPRQTSPGS